MTKSGLAASPMIIGQAPGNLAVKLKFARASHRRKEQPNYDTVMKPTTHGPLILKHIPHVISQATPLTPAQWEALPPPRQRSAQTHGGQVRHHSPCMCQKGMTQPTCMHLFRVLCTMSAKKMLLLCSIMFYIRVFVTCVGPHEPEERKRQTFLPQSASRAVFINMYI